MSFVVTPNNPMVVRAAEFVATQPKGVTIHAISEHLNRSLAHMKNVMSAASRFGLVKPAQDAGRRVLWFTPPLADEFIAVRRAGLAGRRLIQERERARKGRKSNGASTDPHQWRNLPDGPERRLIAANDAPRITTRAPNSVFALGAAA